MGHGTLRRDELTRLPRTADIEALVDIRRFPHSRHNPDVEGDALNNWMPDAGIGYRKEPRRNVLGCSTGKGESGFVSTRSLGCRG